MAQCPNCLGVFSAVNMIKNEWDQDEFISFCRKIVDTHDGKERSKS